MIALSNTVAQTIAPGATATFDVETLHTGCAEFHRAGSGAVRVRPGIYSLAFSGNVGGGATTQPMLAITVDGDALQETSMTATITSATDVFSVGRGTIFKNFFGGTAIAVKNVGEADVTLDAHPSLAVKRIG